MTILKSYVCLSLSLFLVCQIEAATLGDGLNCTTLEWSTGGTPSSMLPNENVKWWYCSGDGVSDNACVSSGGGSGGITNSWLETTIKGPCIISFQYKIMTLNGTFTVKCGDEKLYEYTGATGISPIWKYAEYEIPLGTHKLSFTYRHPGQGYAFVQNGFNGVRIDDFSISEIQNLVITTPSDTIDETDGLMSIKEAEAIVKKLKKGNIVFNIQSTDILQAGMNIDSDVSVDGTNLATGHLMRSEQPVFWSVAPGGKLSNIIIGNNDNMRDGGDMFNKGGLLENITANSGGDIYILGGVSKEILVKNNGALFLNEQHTFSTPCSYAELTDVYIQHGGLLVQKGNVIVTGKLEIAGGMISKDVKGNSIVNQESNVILNLSSWTPQGSFTFTHYHHNYIGRKTISHLVDDISFLKDAGSIDIKVLEQQPLGTYNIAGNANGFDKNISLIIGEKLHSRVLNLGNSFLCGDYSYTLKIVSNTLQLVIGQVPKLKDITINGQSTTNFGSYNPYEVQAIYEDGSTRRITPTWTINMDDYIYLSPDGVLQIRDLPLNLQLNASYTEKNVSKSSTFNVAISLDVSSTSILEYTYEFSPGWQLVSIVMNLDETSKASLLALKPFCFNGNCYTLANDLPAGTSCWIFVQRKTIIKVSGTPCGVIKTRQ